MYRILDHLIAEAPEENEGAVDVQLQIRGGIHAGSLRYFDTPGNTRNQNQADLFELTSLMQDKEGQHLIIKMYFRADAVDCVMQNHAADASVIATRQGGLIIPGAH